MAKHDLVVGVEAVATYAGITYSGRVTRVEEAFIHLSTSAGMFCIPKSFVKVKPSIKEALEQAFDLGWRSSTEDTRPYLEQLIKEMK